MDDTAEKLNQLHDLGLSRGRVLALADCQILFQKFLVDATTSGSPADLYSELMQLLKTIDEMRSVAELEEEKLRTAGIAGRNKHHSHGGRCSPRLIHKSLTGETIMATSNDSNEAKETLAALVVEKQKEEQAQRQQSKSGKSN
jgi:hypothetical protein